MSTPIVPARPTRSYGAPSTATDNIPQVPPRPPRKSDPSPSRDFRSPFNEPPTATGSIPKSNLSAEEVPPRPPSVTLPSLGQEGSEYATYDLLPPEVPGVTNAASAELGTPEQTRNVSEEMPMHAPKASLPQSTAKSRIETVTGTDSTQAAAAGIGKAKPDDDVHKTPADSTTTLDHTISKTEDLKREPSNEPSTLRPKASFNRPPSGASPGASHGSRPASIYEDVHEQGIPHIGQYTPLNPNAGDVQAPSPGPTQSQHAPGIGFFNDGSSRAHQRKRSGKHEFGPPGSYGLHSHSLEPHDHFEREWYAKNREKAAMEEYNLYGRPKPETALSSAELNRIVTQTDDVGMGSNPNMIGTPGEETAFSASDAYVARISPMVSPAPAQPRKRHSSSGSQPAAGSPLRRMTSYPFPKGQQAVEDDDVDVIHIDPPEYRTSKITGGGPADGAVDLGPHAGNTPEEGGWFVERGMGTPILASDEVLKRRESASMQPAINPEYHFDTYDEYAQHDNSRRSSMRVPSRPSSRPGSIHADYQGGNLHRFITHEDLHGSNSHTPLEEIEEYEPLIPEGDDHLPKPKPTEVKRRPGIEHHHFPSRDIWEDTPSSLHYQTTVETPDIAPPPSSGSKLFETPEQEHMRRDQNPNNMLSDEKTLLKPHYATRTIDNTPGVQRFPSKDIWEDTPTSLQYHTTVGGPQMDDTRSPPDDRPTTSAIPGSQDDSEARATTGFTQTMPPSIPARPQRRSKLAEEIKPGDEDGQQYEESRDLGEEKPPSPEKAKAPPIPERPKPTVPVRPARSSRSDQTNGAGAELAKITSRESQSSADAATSPPVPKAKPAVPARPGGEKLAALKAGFMSDLNNRLKIGPTGPPPKSKEIEPEVAEETPKAPLADTRKGRARGPARRKPAASPSAVAENKSATCSMSTPLTVWSIDENDKLQVPSTSTAPATADSADLPVLEKVMSDKAAANTEEPVPSTDLPQLEKVLSDNTIANTEEPALAEPMSPEKALSPPPSGDQDAAPSIEEQKSIQTPLVASLADVGVAPAPEEIGKDVPSAPEGTDATEMAVAGKAVEGEGTVEDERQGVAAS